MRKRDQIYNTNISLNFKSQENQNSTEIYLYSINFDQQLLTTIDEAETFEILCLPVPEIANNITLQKDAYLQTIEELSTLIRRHDAVLKSLDDQSVIFHVFFEYL